MPMIVPLRSALNIFSLSGSEWKSIYLARRRLIEIDKSLNTAGLSATKAALSATPPNFVFPKLTLKQLVRTIDRAARLSVGRNDSCLRRSLLLWWILTNRGVGCELRVGVSSTAGDLSGHAWVEIDGKPINDRESNISRFHIINVEDA